MSDSVTEIKPKPQPDKLRLEWGLPVEDGRFLWEHDNLTVRVYCDPFPDIGTPQLLGSGLDGKQQTRTKGYVIPFPFLELGEGWETTESAFRPGMPFASSRGKCYPLHFKLKGVSPEPDAVVGYIPVAFPISSTDWLDRPVTIWAEFGYVDGDTFHRVHTSERFQFGKAETGSPADKVLPDIDIPDDERVTHRGAAPKLMISYARADMQKHGINEVALRLNRQHYYDVWIDYDNIPIGEDWKTSIAAGIKTADRVIFMMSPNSVKSDWCRAELRYALEQGVKIIPLRLQDNCTLDDLEIDGIGNDLNWFDFTRTDESAWDKLIANLPDVQTTRRDIRLNSDAEFKTRHERYLRSIFTRLGEVRIPNFSRERVDLMDVYVPLKLGVSFNIDVVDKQYAGWWLRDQDNPEREMMLEDGKQPQKPQVLRGFEPQGKALEAWERELEDTLYREHGDEIKDQTYNWKRIESETAPALMPHLVVTGLPGSGKSTLLKHMSLCNAGDMLSDDRANLEAFRFWPHPALTPIYIELRPLVRQLFPNVDDKVELSALFDYITENHLQPYDIADYLDDLKTQLDNGEAIIFLDGLDEVSEANKDKRRAQIQSLVRTLQTTYPDCRIVITSRPYAYESNWLQEQHFGWVELAPLDEDRLRELALRLFRVVLGGEGAEQEAESFQNVIKQVRAELRQTPLFFSLMAAIWLKNHTKPADERLPVSEGDIYRESVEMMVERWAEKDFGGESLIDRIGLTRAQLRDVLELLAYRVHSGAQGDDDAVFAGGEIFNALLELNVGRIDPYELKDALSQRAGVIFEREPNQFQFAHRSFQEHLSACYLTSHHDLT